MNLSFAIPAFRGEYLEHLVFVINRPPEVMRLPVDLHKNLAQVPTLVGIRLMINPALHGLCSKHRTKSVSQEPYHLVVDVDAAFARVVYFRLGAGTVPEGDHRMGQWTGAK